MLLASSSEINIETESIQGENDLLPDKVLG